MSTTPDMLFDLGGRPLGGVRYSNPFATHYFIDGNSGNGSDANDGLAPDRAKATIQSAVTAATVGDVIYVRPKTYVVGTGHARYEECVTVDLAESDLSIIGAGYSRNNEFGVRMKCDGTTLYCFDISGPSCHLENMGFFASSATNTIIVRNNGATNTQRGSDGFCAYNCNFKGHTTLLQGGQAGRFVNCVFFYASASQLTIATPTVSGYGQQIVDCNFLDNNGSQTTGPYLSSDGGHVYNILIKNCAFGRIPSGGKFCSFGGSTGTGLVLNCGFNYDDTSSSTDFTLNTNIRVIGGYDDTGTMIA